MWHSMESSFSSALPTVQGSSTCVVIIFHITFRGPVGAISMEQGIPQDVLDGLRSLGHSIDGPVQGFSRSIFGRGHVITRGAWWAQDETNIDKDNTIWWVGSDGRADGLALGY